MTGAEARSRERGGALPLALAVAFLLLLAASAVLVVGGAHVAAARAQTAADLAAVSGARALVQAVGRAERRGGVGRAAARAARAAAQGSGGRISRLHVSSPDLPPAVEVAVRVPGPLGLAAIARARAGLAPPPSDDPGPRGWASGGGYSGPLVYRDGKPTCPAVAAAFDGMDRAARALGVDLVVTSGFRSDAEQARLFRRHPDPRWVAPPGSSRHRDATELDISTGGGAGAWLRAHGREHGFVQRYAWEPWHWGHIAGCGQRPTTGGGAGGRSVPAWVPGAYRGLIAASARRERLSPWLLAALLRVESGFDPRAVSPAGARGIAQLMPATAGGLGVSDPFDPRQAIPAAGRLLADHLRAFGTPRLALAAYNAGAGAVRRHGGVPPYRETRAYVAAVLAAAGDLGPQSGDVVLLPLGRAMSGASPI